MKRALTPNEKDTVRALKVLIKQIESGEAPIVEGVLIAKLKNETEIIALFAYGDCVTERQVRQLLMDGRRYLNQRA